MLRQHTEEKSQSDLKTQLTNLKKLHKEKLNELFKYSGDTTVDILNKIFVAVSNYTKIKYDIDTANFKLAPALMPSANDDIAILLLQGAKNYRDSNNKDGLIDFIYNAYCILRERNSETLFQSVSTILHGALKLNFKNGRLLYANEIEDVIKKRKSLKADLICLDKEINRLTHLLNSIDNVLDEDDLNNGFTYATTEAKPVTNMDSNNNLNTSQPASPASPPHSSANNGNIESKVVTPSPQVDTNPPLTPRGKCLAERSPSTTSPDVQCDSESVRGKIQFFNSLASPPPAAGDSNPTKKPFQKNK